MADWKHEQGYKEPEECWFCEHYAYDHEESGEVGVCFRGERPPFDMETHELRAIKEDRKCRARGTCRYFVRRVT